MSSNEQQQYSGMRVLQQTVVSPSPASLEHPASTLPLTFFDIVWLRGIFMEPLYLYEFPHPTDIFMEAYLPGLKSSLSQTLHRFFPLAGRLISPGHPDPTNKYELRYADGDSVPFAVVESTGTDLDFLDIVGSHPRRSSKLKSLVPHLPHPLEDGNAPLLAVQVTVFPDRGIAVGYSLNHTVCDGFSHMHFVDSWAACCRSIFVGPAAAAAAGPPPPPSFDRSVVVDPCNLYSEYLSDVLGFRNDRRPSVLPPAESQPDLVTASFALGSSQVGWLKGRLARPTPNCSTYVVSTAYVWVCLAKAGVWSADGVGNAHFMFLADWRKRLGGVADWYFGNCVGVCFAEAKVGDLVKPAEGMVAACDAIGSAIEGLKEGFTKNMVGKNKKFQSILPCRPLAIVGSPKFKVYDIDFGWGRPAKFEFPSLGSGAASMSEGRDEQGGLEIGVVLPKDGMEAFMLHFEEGLK